jgi:hypothetical protein
MAFHCLIPAVLMLLTSGGTMINLIGNGNSVPNDRFAAGMSSGTGR